MQFLLRYTKAMIRKLWNGLGEMKPRNTSALILILMLGAGVILIARQLVFDKNASTDVCIKYETVTNGGKSTPIGKKQCVLSLEKVDTEAAREHGLSDRPSMPSSHGMLFVFDNIGRQCIWMKNMHFDLDIAWLDVRGNVVKLEEGLKPETYPNEYCADNTFFVIEVNAHVAKSAGLSVGSHINL
ncbi:MAG: hypothetical protein JWO47_356 [Candidatus Saccharibacteria bacterium]|nr:hypothetical protein [Candidatus Saccharibacteria bacterium]